MTPSIPRLRDALLRAGYDSDGVLDLLGPHAHDALARGETVPARRASSGRTPLETLVRLFLLQLVVPEADARAALPLPDALEGGLVEQDAAGVRALLDIRPYGPDDAPDGWWLVSDLGTGLDGVHRPLRDDHVLGVGGASTTLAQLTPRDEVGRALDIGTGCGVQALHLSRHARTVVGTDVLPRALALARLTAALNDLDVDLRLGSLTEPVAGEQFDLVVSNPPFVIGSPETRTYRDAGMALDGVTQALLRSVPALLTDRGRYVGLANWVRLHGQGTTERIEEWLPTSGCESQVIVRDEQDPAAYVATWLRDAGEEGGPRYVERYDGWLSALEHAGVESIAFGWVMLRRASAPSGSDVLAWPHPVEQPLAAWLATRLDAVHRLRSVSDDALLASTVIIRGDVVQEAVGPVGAEDPATIVLRQQRGLRLARQVGSELAALAGACDGSVPLDRLISAVGIVLDRSTQTLREQLLPGVRGLVADGFLVPEGW